MAKRRICLTSALEKLDRPVAGSDRLVKPSEVAQGEREIVRERTRPQPLLAPDEDVARSLSFVEPFGRSADVHERPKPADPTSRPPDLVAERERDAGGQVKRVERILPLTENAE